MQNIAFSVTEKLIENDNLEPLLMLSFTVTIFSWVCWHNLTLQKMPLDWNVYYITKSIVSATGPLYLS